MAIVASVDIVVSVAIVANMASVRRWLFYAESRAVASSLATPSIEIINADQPLSHR